MYLTWLYNKVLWFELFLEASAEILKKFVGVLVETMTPKSTFEINWPLMPIWRASSPFCSCQPKKVVKQGDIIFEGTILAGELKPKPTDFQFYGNSNVFLSEK